MLLARMERTLHPQRRVPDAATEYVLVHAKMRRLAPETAAAVAAAQPDKLSNFLGYTGK